RILSARRPPHADPDAVVVGRAEGLGQRSQPVVAAAPATQLDPELTGRDLQLVVDRDDPFRRYILLACDAGVRGPGLVHEPGRHDEQYSLVVDAELCHVGRHETGLPEANAARAS